MPLEQQGLATSVLPNFAMSANIGAGVAIAVEAFVTRATALVTVGVLRAALNTI